jgi:hypothetical protein
MKNIVGVEPSLRILMLRKPLGKFPAVFGVGDYFKGKLEIATAFTAFYRASYLF